MSLRRSSIGIVLASAVVLALAGCGEQAKNTVTTKPVAHVAGGRSGVYVVDTLVANSVDARHTRRAALLGVFISQYLASSPTALVGGGIAGISVQNMIFEKQGNVSDPDFDLIQALADALQVDVLDLLNRSLNRQETLDIYIASLNNVAERAQNRLSELMAAEDTQQETVRSLNQERVDLDRELRDATDSKDYLLANEKQKALNAKEREISEAKLKLDQMENVSNSLDDLLRVYSEKIVAIQENREPLIAGTKVIDLPGVLDLKILERSGNTSGGGGSYGTTTTHGTSTTGGSSGGSTGGTTGGASTGGTSGGTSGGTTGGTSSSRNGGGSRIFGNPFGSFGGSSSSRASATGGSSGGSTGGTTGGTSGGSTGGASGGTTSGGTSGGTTGGTSGGSTAGTSGGTAGGTTGGTIGGTTGGGTNGGTNGGATTGGTTGGTTTGGANGGTTGGTTTGGGGGGGGGVFNISGLVDGSTSIYDLVSLLIAFLLIIGLFLCLIYLVYGGIRFITSAGNEESIKKAVGTVRYAILGLVVCLMGYFIVWWLAKLLDAPFNISFDHILELMRDMYGNLRQPVG